MFHFAIYFYSYQSSTAETVCDVVVKQGGLDAKSATAYKYVLSQTSTISDVNPRRAGTGGGVTMTIVGTGFTSVKSNIEVTIDEVSLFCFNHLCCFIFIFKIIILYISAIKYLSISTLFLVYKNS